MRVFFFFWKSSRFQRWGEKWLKFHSCAHVPSAAFSCPCYLLEGLRQLLSTACVAKTHWAAFFKIATTRIKLLCCRQHKHKPVPMLGITGNVGRPTKCQRRWLNLMNNLHGWYSLPRCHPLAVICRRLFTFQDNVAASQTFDEDHPEEAAHAPEAQRPFQAPSKTARGGEGKNETWRAEGKGLA